jgi:hypothetical protein
MNERRFQQRYGSARALLTLFVSLGLALSPLVPALPTPTANAATINVTGGCTLHDAVQSITNGADFGTCIGMSTGTYGVDDELDLQPSTYSVTTPLPTLPSGISLLVSGNNATIDWNGSGRLWTIDGPNTTVELENLTIQGNGAQSGLLVTNGATVQLDGVTMQRLQSTVAGDAWGDGGAILAMGGSTVQATNSLFRDNVAELSGGAILAIEGSTVVIEDSRLWNNTAQSVGGAVAAFDDNTRVVLENVEVVGNRAAGGGGIATAFGAQAEIDGAEIRQNEATISDGGGIWVVFGGSVSVTGSLIAENVAAEDGGGIAAGWGEGPGGGGQVMVRDSVVRDNRAGAYGGGISVIDDSHLELSGSAIAQNEAGLRGGGISVTIGATANISDSSVVGNTAIDGGGIEIQGAAARLEGVTIAGNEATRFGGGLHLQGGLVHAVNVTLSGNQAPDGSAARLNNTSTLTLSFVTVADHQGSAALWVDGSSTLRLKHTLLANPAVAECQLDTGATLAVQGVVLADDSSCSDPSITIDPALRSTLGPLQNNGGLTDTHALLPGSPALDITTDCTDWDGAPPVITDQRGIIRPQNGRCDVGAFEFRTSGGGGGGGGDGGGGGGGDGGGGGGGDSGSGGGGSDGGGGRGGGEIPAQPVPPAVPGLPSIPAQPAPAASQPPLTGVTVSPSGKAALPQLLPQTGFPTLDQLVSSPQVPLAALLGTALLSIGLVLRFTGRRRQTPQHTR